MDGVRVNWLGEFTPLSTRKDSSYRSLQKKHVFYYNKDAGFLA